jgi:hypothetical protein
VCPNSRLDQVDGLNGSVGERFGRGYVCPGAKFEGGSKSFHSSCTKDVVFHLLRGYKTPCMAAAISSCKPALRRRGIGGMKGFAIAQDSLVRSCCSEQFRASTDSSSRNLTGLLMPSRTLLCRFHRTYMVCRSKQLLLAIRGLSTIL